MRKIVLALLICVFFLLSACMPEKESFIPSDGTPGPTVRPEERQSPRGDTLLTPETYPRVDGSTATIPLAISLLSRTCGIPIDEAALYVAHTKTNLAYLQLIDGQADLLLAYEPPEEALLQAEYAQYRWEMHPIGRDALVFIVNEKNPINSLTKQQIIDIYQGKITNWSEVGGEDYPIEAFQRDSQSGSQTLMNKLVMKELPMIKAPSDLIPSEMGELIEVMRSYDNSANAIGYSVFYYVSQMTEMTGLKMIAIDDIPPSIETIGSGSYPYLNDFYAVIPYDEPSDTPTQKLLALLLSEEGKSLVEECGYVAVR